MDNQPYAAPPPERHRIPVLKILGTIMLIMVVICGGLVTYVAYNFPRWAASLARGPLIAVVDQSELPADQKASIKQSLNRVADAFQQRRISYTQFRSILTSLGKGPFFNIMMTEAMRYQYTLAHPALDDARRETMMLFDRLERGVVEGLIPQSQIAQLMALVHDPDQQHSGKPSNAVTEAELQPFIDHMRTVVEQAKIPAVPYQADFAAVIEKAITAVLGPGFGAISTRPEATRPAATTSAPASGLPGPEPQ